MRGIIAGKGNVGLAAGAGLNSAVEPAYEINQTGSHTLQERDFKDTAALRAKLIEATLEALADGSAPRLEWSRSWA